jgi:hypothetical protein
MSPEFGAQISLRNIGNKYGLWKPGPRGRKYPPEEIANRAAAIKAAWAKRVNRNHSSATRAKISAAKMNPSTESRARMSASAKARYARMRSQINTLGKNEEK